MLFRSGMTTANEGYSPSLEFFFFHDTWGDTRSLERRWLVVGNVENKEFLIGNYSSWQRRRRRRGLRGVAAPRWPADGSGVVS